MKAGSVAPPLLGGATFFGANGSCEPQEQNCRIPIERRHVAMKKRGKPGCLCKTVLHYAKNRIGGICPCIPLSVASVPLFDLKPVAGMTAWNEKCGRVPNFGTRPHSDRLYEP